MQRTMYTCDNCEQEIGRKKHVTMQLAQHSGIAVPPIGNEPGILGVWTIEPRLQGKFLHFCNGICVGRFFSKLLKTCELPIFTGKKIK